MMLRSTSAHRSRHAFSKKVVSKAALRLEALEERLVLSGSEFTFDGTPETVIEIEHSSTFALDNGTFALEFTPEGVTGRKGLFSKDARGYEEGGHFSAFVVNKRVEVRLQNAEKSFYVHSDYGDIQAGETYHMVVTFGETGLRLYIDGELEDAEAEFDGGIAANTNDLVVGANAWARDARNPDWLSDYYVGTISDFTVYDRALTRAEVAAIGGSVGGNESTHGTTETGLDTIVDLIHADPGLYRRVDPVEIAAGATAADKMNHIIIAAIRGTGVANDGTLTEADLYNVNQYIRENHLDDWILYHGDDEGNVETGFHLVQNDGASTRIFGRENAVNTVADGIYHMGFEIRDGRFLNEDGNKNASVETVAFWVSEFLEEDLAGDSLKNPDVNPYAHATTGTGLDLLVDIITDDPGLNDRIPTYEITEAATAADEMNLIVVDAIRATGVANDGTISEADVYDMNQYIRANHLDDWILYHGDDEDGEETGFHLVQNDGATTRLFDDNAVNTVADGIYHMGFEIRDGRFLNEDGNKNASVETVAFWVNEFLEEDLAGDSLKNLDVNPYVVPTTGTGLDEIVNIIADDPGLNDRIATYEITEGATAADKMNNIIIAAIRETGVANDGTIGEADVYDMNQYIRANHLDDWILYHGDDEDGEETGFHLVQNDGATTRLYDNNAVNTVADGIYHMGFEIRDGRFLNEDGNKNASVETVAFWVNEFLEEDLAGDSLKNPDVNPYATPTTGTGLDEIVNIIANDPGLNDRIPLFEITEGATAADKMNNIIIAAIRGTGVANDGEIDSQDIYDINAHIRAEHLEEWITLHGDDEDGEETGFHLVQNDGARTEIYNRNAVNTVADGLYHLGFKIESGRLLNEDGNRNASVLDVAYWLDELLEKDLAGDGLKNPDLAPDLNAIANSVSFTHPTVTVSDGEGYADVEHVSDLELANGSFAMSFVAQDVSGRNTLFSKDARDYRDGGDFTAFVNNGRIEVRLQSPTKSYYLSTSYGSIQPGQEYHVVIGFGESGLKIYLNGVLTKSRTDYDGGITANTEDMAIGANKWASDERNPGWRADFFEGEISNFTVYNRALTRHEVAAVAEGKFFDPGEAPNQGTTDTGLDDIVNIIYADPGLNARIDQQEIVGGATAADKMNQIIITAIQNTGVANDGTVTEADLYNVNKYIRANHLDDWIKYHGDDENGEETGFHLVQNDGATTKIFGDDNAVNTVADGIYHMGFEIRGGRFLNEDGNKNASVETVAFWVSEFLEEDLAGDSLKNLDVNPYAVPTTGTGLDQLVNIIANDPGLNDRIPLYEITEGAMAADAMNTIIIAAIQGTGVASDGVINEADVRDINAYIRAEHLEEWIKFHGDDEKGEETGFHLVQNDGANTDLFNRNAVNTVADGLYHLGFEIKGNNLLNEDGNRNASLSSVAYWLNELLANDFGTESLASNVNAYAQPTTGTGLDQLVNIIAADPGLNYRISTSEITEGAMAADAMNTIIIAAIQGTGVASDGVINEADVRGINAYIRAEHLEEWIKFHGDDEKGEETGFHLVQNDGANTDLFNRNAVNTVADGLYHLGFEIERDRLLNEDGNRNASLSSVAYWLNELLANDFGTESLASSVNPYAVPTTGTGLDQLVNIIANDSGLNYRISTSEITEGASAADAMNTIIITAIRGTGIANDGEIDSQDVYEINAYIRANHLDEWIEFHGDDECGEETGFHLVQNDGARSELYRRNAVDTVADGIYHLGFQIEKGRLLNEDGNANACVAEVAFWLNDLLEADLAAGTLANPALNPDPEQIAQSVVFKLESANV